MPLCVTQQPKQPRHWTLHGARTHDLRHWTIYLIAGISSHRNLVRLSYKFTVVFEAEFSTN
eukprot:1359080-Amorphochlora_amoeboformis.AAC.1